MGLGPLSLPANLAPFALGMLLAVASAHIQTSGTVPRVLALMGRAPLVWWTVAVVAWASTVKLVGMCVVYTRATLPGPGQMLAEQLLFAIAGAAAVVPAVLGDQHRGLSRRLLQLRPVVFVGVVSYGVYLWHETVLAELVNHLGVTARSGNFVVLTVRCVLGSVAIASFSYYALERPLIRFSHHPHRLHVLRRLAGHGGRSRRARPGPPRWESHPPSTARSRRFPPLPSATVRSTTARAEAASCRGDVVGVSPAVAPRRYASIRSSVAASST